MTPPITIVGIDPGTTHSGVVIWVPFLRAVTWSDPALPNEELRAMLINRWGSADHRIVCEWIQSMGMVVGKEVFETCRFIGQLKEIVESRGQTFEMIVRPVVKTRLCGSPRAKDPNVRQALIDRIGPQGTKKNPGPTFGVSSHAWSALAVAVAIDLK